MRIAGGPTHDDTSIIEHRCVQTPASGSGGPDADRPPYHQPTTGQAMGIGQHMASIVEENSSVEDPSHHGRPRASNVGDADGDHNAMGMGHPVSDRPSWVCCAHGNRDHNMEHWYDVMVGLPVDEAARMSVISLAQYSPSAYDKVCSIFDKIERGRSGSVINWSSYLARCVETARRELNPAGDRLYGGRGGHARSRSSH